MLTTKDLLYALVNGRKIKLPHLKEYLQMDETSGKIMVMYNSSITSNAVAGEYMVHINMVPEQFIILED